ncbi:FAD-dependent monooxygenase [Ktedonobacter racemifer]|uniref:Monooxygenase FAD-binding n=1 Tax=Ktedonobacter racemifer DSM 44963 TaxID=485913 RepID=D6U1N9_KTERA|nr:FAD-dependent monooxygenase [Ktedonobacter racemifer]EFH82683.1 monooxygenase FAD-binding [Ktedonobacter racemifer DSM 44963]
MSQSATNTYDIEVLVVGAGPTGMVMASELKRHGMQCRIIDRLPQPSHTSKALSIHARTLELFEKMGLTNSFLAEGVKVKAMNIYGDKHHRIAQINMQHVPSRYPFMLCLPQWETENILNEHLTRQEIKVERAVELTELQQTGNGVDVVLEHANGQREQLRTRWLIGCDGPHSTVRHLLGFDFKGSTFEQSFALADVHMGSYLPVHQASFFWQEGDFIGCLPIPHEQYRIIIGYKPGTEPKGDVTLEEVQRILEKCGMTDVRVHDAVWSSRFQVNQRKVHHYRQGSVLMAGDACHIHSPIAGQGMNTGIQDAFNLAWKLALVSQEKAQPHLLDSYEAERERFGRLLLRGTNFFSRLALSQGALPSRLRDSVAPLVISSKIASKRIATLISQVAASYRRSPIVSEYQEGNLFGALRERQRMPIGHHAGERAPDMVVYLGKTPMRLHMLCLGTRHVLFFFAHQHDPERSLQEWEEMNAILKRRHSDLVDAFLILPRPPESSDSERTHIIYDENAAIYKEYGITDDGLVLVRPDGYIGFLSRPASLGRLGAYLDSIFVVSPIPTPITVTPGRAEHKEVSQ